MSEHDTKEKIQVLGVPLQGLNFVTVCIVGFLAKNSLEAQEENQTRLQQTTMEMRDDLRSLKTEIDLLQRKVNETEQLGDDVSQIKSNYARVRDTLDTVAECLRTPRKRCTI